MARKQSFRIIVLLTLGLLLTASVLSQGERILTIATPAWMGDVFRPELFADFEAEHGVKVVVVSDEGEWYGSPTGDLDDALEKWTGYASLADVVYLPTWLASPFATEAGVWLDLAPLVAADPDINVDDFFPAVWDAFGWNGGQWAIPVSADVQFFVYDKNKFDEAGLPYPNEGWTMDDVLNAGRALTVYEADGDVEIPGLGAYSTGVMMAMFGGQGLVADDGTPSFQRFAPLIEDFAAFQEEMIVDGNYDFQAVPFHISTPWQLTNSFGNEQGEEDWQGALLPNITALIEASGFAVSAGTQYPELAYELAKSMSSDALVVNRFFSNSPARQSMVGVPMPEDSDVFFSTPEIEPEVRAMIDTALLNGMPRSQLAFEDFLWSAINDMNENGTDATTALQNAEQDALEALQTAQDYRTTTVIAIPTPIPTPVAGEGQIILKFGAGMDQSYQPDGWDQVLADFVAANPQVANVNVIDQFFSGEDFETLDCFYVMGSYLSTEGATEDLLPLDPFLDADPDFDRADVLPGVMEQVTANNMTYGYPVTLSPAVLWYDSELFEQANILAPEESRWNIEAFRDALDVLRSTLEDPDDPVFLPQQWGNTYLLMLIAAYGGIPYDLRTDPPTLNFSDPATQDAVRQVLDLARAGLIDYTELAGNGGMIGGMEAPIFDDTLSAFNWRLQQRDEMGNQNLRLTHFPSGSQYTPVAYSVGAIYIRNTAQDPEACYNLMKMIGSRPDLFGGMPARASLLTDATVALNQGDDVMTLYRQFGEKLSEPNVLLLPGSYGGGSSSSPGGWIEQIWVNQAFDKYVLENVPLEQALADAETNITTYRECIAPIPATNLLDLDTPDTIRPYMRQFTDCALALDESLRSQFEWYYQED